MNLEQKLYFFQLRILIIYLNFIKQRIYSAICFEVIIINIFNIMAKLISKLEISLGAVIL